ncbi:MAG: penicillin-binding protein 2 [Patescibacteria group bacterium]|jgi:penicillin-binding protein 2
MDIFGNFGALRGDRKKRKIPQGEENDFSYSDAVISGITKIEDRAISSLTLPARTLLIMFFIVLLAKVFFLQVVEGKNHQKLAEGNRIRPRVLEAPRGLISDKDGVWLARNKADFALSFYPSDLPKAKADRAEIFKKLADVSGLAPEEIQKIAEEKGNYFLDSVIIKDHLSHDEALLLEERTADLPGVFIAHRVSREYVSLPGISHILGYTGSVSGADLKDHPNYFLSDWIGKAGIEKEYEQYLRGVHGVEQVEVDSRGNVVRVLVKEGNMEPKPGNDVSLYLDRGLQSKVALSLQDGIKKAKEITGKEDINSGVAAVMDVRNGGILAMVSLPDYDNNLFATRISNDDYQRLINDPSQPLFNRAIKGEYPPGSIVKIVMAAAGLSEGVINEGTSLDTPPAIQIGDYSFPDWKDHGLTDVERAIAESNNIFFYAIGGGYDKIRGIGIAKIKEYWQKFGLGKTTGIDIPGEENGLLPDGEWKQKVKNEPWYLGDTYHVSIGQGDLLVTPIQMLRATAAIANGGKLLNPRFIKTIIGLDGEVVKEFGPSVENEAVVSSQVASTVARGMRMTVTEGSARSLNSLPVAVAGKTGTAQFFNNEKTHAWFEAFAPYDDPEIAVIVLIEGGGGGNETAVPVAKDILDYYFSR